MIFGGLQKFSLLDFPGHIAAIIFTQGCNFRCQFCYNPVLVLPGLMADKLSDTNTSRINQKGHPSPIEEDDLFAFLDTRAGKLDSVVITGGEPTMHNDLPRFIKKIKEKGFAVKLDTNGTNPRMLKKLADKKLLDYIAMDLKASEDKYNATTGVSADLQKIKESIKIIVKSGLPHEFRTTVVPGLIEHTDIKAMANMIAGAEKWFLQKFKSDIALINSGFEGAAPFTDKDMEEMRDLALKYVKHCEIR